MIFFPHRIWYWNSQICIFYDLVLEPNWSRTICPKCMVKGHLFKVLHGKVPMSRSAVRDHEKMCSEIEELIGLRTKACWWGEDKKLWWQILVWACSQSWATTTIKNWETKVKSYSMDMINSIIIHWIGKFITLPKEFS